MVSEWTFGVATLCALLLLHRALKASALRSGATPGTAARILDAAETLGVVMIAAAETRTHAGEPLAERATWTAVFGTVAVAAVVLGGRAVSGAFLRGHGAAQIREGNVAAAVAGAGHVLAGAIVASECLVGASFADLAVSVASFLVASAVLHALAALFRALTTYDDAAEILGGNVAAAISHAGACVALGLVVGHAVHGPWQGFGASLAAFGAALAAALALYPVRQIVVETILLGGRPRLRGGRVDDGVGRGRDAGYAALEAGTFLGVALMARSVA